MIGKVKLFFGIEGLKVDLEIQETFTVNDSSIGGSVRLHSKTAQRLKKLQILLKETYQRGRKADKRVNDYILGSIELNEDVLISANGEKIIDFNLPFKFQHSSMEKLGQKSMIHHQISKMAKWINNTKSEFAVEVATQVDGTALNPSARKEIQLIK
ncbi:MAG: sporulation protein [Saprospiraceae bacterium]